MICGVKVFQCLSFAIVFHMHSVFVQCSQCVEQTRLEMLYIDNESWLDDEEMQEFEGGETENNFHSDPCLQSQNLSKVLQSNYDPSWDGCNIILGHCQNAANQKILSKGNIIRCGVQNRYTTVTLVSSVPMNSADSSHIAFINVSNLLQTSKGKARIQYGGVGCKYTSIQLRSQKNKGFNYTIEVYGS